jgi:hypothetical protein
VQLSKVPNLTEILLRFLNSIIALLKVFTLFYLHLLLVSMDFMLAILFFILLIFMPVSLFILLTTSFFVLALQHIFMPIFGLTVFVEQFYYLRQF